MRHFTLERPSVPLDDRHAASSPRQDVKKRHFGPICSAADSLFSTKRCVLQLKLQPRFLSLILLFAENNPAVI